jgi:hypothetical protein
MPPYENRLNSENFRHVALVAEVSIEAQAADVQLMQADPVTNRWWAAY